MRNDSIMIGAEWISAELGRLNSLLVKIVFDRQGILFVSLIRREYIDSLYVDMCAYRMRTVPYVPYVPWSNMDWYLTCQSCGWFRGIVIGLAAVRVGA